MRLSALFSFVVLGVAACSATTEEAPAGGTEAVTGITDLSALEAELGLVKDTQDAHGRWSRPEAKLTGGACYEATVGSSAGASFELRRYTKGAAFFAKLGATAEAGAKRPIACVDIDVDDTVDGKPETFTLSGISLDAVMRYHLGKTSGAEGATGHVFVDFERGGVEIGDSDHYCGFHGSDGTSAPGNEAFAQAIASCKQHGGDEDSCNERAMAACEKAVAKDVLADAIDRPAFPSIDSAPGAYFYNLTVQQDPAGNDAFLPGLVPSLVYRYAWKIAANRNAFTLAGDPIGKFLSVEDANPNGDLPVLTHFRFEKLDAHRIVNDEMEQIAITPKGKDAPVPDSSLASLARRIQQSALVLCTRAIDGGGNASTPFTCRGL